MSDQEKELRARIAAEIATRFGQLAPYKMVADFVRKGPSHA